MAQTTITGRKFKADKLPAREANRLMLKLAKFLGPAAPAIYELIAGGGVKEAASALAGDNQDGLKGAIKSVGQFLAMLDIDATDKLLVEICEHAQAITENGAVDDIVFDVHMRDLGEAYQLAYFVLTTNFKDFFPAKVANSLK